MTDAVEKIKNWDIEFDGDDETPKDKKEKKVEVDAMGRRVWDKKFFAEKAAAKAAGSDESEDEKFTPIPISQRQYLQARNAKVDLTKDLNKFKIITDQTSKKDAGGYWCNVCECQLRDSQTYLDHINGRPHNRRLGMTMKVEKVEATDVAKRLKQLRGNKDDEKKKDDEEEEEDIEARMERLEREAAEKIQKKKDKKKKKTEKREMKEETMSESAPKKIKTESNLGLGIVYDSEDEDELKNRGGNSPISVQDPEEMDDDEEEEAPNPELEMMKAMGLPCGFN